MFERFKYVCVSLKLSECSMAIPTIKPLWYKMAVPPVPGARADVAE
jgi:hypothetical protein